MENRPEALSTAEFQRVLESVVRANEALAAQNQALQELLKKAAGLTNTNTCAKSAESDLSAADQAAHHEAEQTNAEVWQGIFSMSATSSKEFMEAFYHWDRPTTVQQVLSSSATWTSWSYTAAFPQLSNFLKGVSLGQRCHCQVDMDDLLSIEDGRRSTSYHESRNKIDVFWEAVKSRPAFPRIEGQSPEKRASARLFKIIDLSPLVLTALLGSTPQSDISYMAAFVERHLKLSNYGKVSLLKFGDLDWSSYTFEYHFSFFYVTPEYADPDAIKLDPRKARRSAPFGQEMATKTRSIHEETLSFLLVGHFKDVTTCVQLAESYFKFDPYAKKALSHPFRHYDLTQSPGLMLLSWISVGLHHVLWRWASAIEAVENEVKSSAQIVFMTDRSDLMADDPQFSLSKTYFWALQAYKLFEETLLDTISTWKQFKEESLPRLEDPRIPQEDWETSIEDIDDAIRELESKVFRIRKRYKEVKDLRTGLISASALFDSRTTVRQGENIRLLTYITILFFPLSFGTSIFGMQFMGSNNKYITAFAISLPTITVVTALLVFNLQMILDSFSAFAEKSTSWLRASMRSHRRGAWKARAVALQENEAMHKAPVRHATRLASGWVYTFFVLEWVLAALPVAEIVRFMKWVGLRREKDETLQRTPSIMALEMGGTDQEVISDRVRRRRRNEMIKEKIYQSLEEENKRKQKERERERPLIVRAGLALRRGAWAGSKAAGRFILGLLRAMLIPVWLLLLAIEYLLLLIYFAIRRDTTPSSARIHIANRYNTSPPIKNRVHVKAYETLGLDAIHPLAKAHPPALNRDELEAVGRVATMLTAAPKGASRSTTMQTNRIGSVAGAGSALSTRQQHLQPPTPSLPQVEMKRMGRDRKKKGSDEVTLKREGDEDGLELYG